ncbi:cytochrome P450 [Ktedonosporobacter rubrisoli]|uniref:Cytochrome P450 n=1 Tax=Ktedonosporobacter rubrisoli TaxID=2509675 RepID=A0A4P6K416_KTERU|nr:cytochrome P450 [Ktedonosporobacter rubrisoli]QBD82795.1 cytochrome P450 [Ktedonosporobacter rubrisoli]
MRQTRSLPPGPRSPLLGSVVTMQKDPIGFTLGCWRDYGDVVSTRFLLSQLAILLYHPDHAKYVMQNPAKYDKRISVIQGVKVLMGEGLFTNDDEKTWRVQRRLFQPLFQQKNMPLFDALITSTTQSLLSEWQAYVKSGQVIDMEQEMRKFILRTIARTLFSIDLETSIQTQIDYHLQTMVPLLSDYMNFPFPPLSIPTTRNVRLKRAVQALDAIIYSLIERYKAAAHTPAHDLLSLLLAVRHEDGHPLNDKQVRDEVVTFLLGGHDTTAHTLAFTWYALSRYPDVEKKFSEELDAVLGGRLPTIEDLPRLSYTHMIIDEVLRLYPSAFALVRRAVEDDEIAGYHVPKNSLMIPIPYAVQRHPDFWENPDEFDPERFATDQEKRFPHIAYMPFGSGPHLCVAKYFGTMMVQLALVTIAQQYRLQLAPTPPVELLFRISLRSRHGIPMSISAR